MSAPQRHDTPPLFLLKHLFTRARDVLRNGLVEEGDDDVLQQTAAYFEEAHSVVAATDQGSFFPLLQATRINFESYEQLSDFLHGLSEDERRAHIRAAHKTFVAVKAGKPAKKERTETAAFLDLLIGAVDLQEKFTPLMAPQVFD